MAWWVRVLAAKLDGLNLSLSRKIEFIASHTHTHRGTFTRAYTHRQINKYKNKIK